MAKSFVRPFVDHVIQDAERNGKIRSELSCLQVFDHGEISNLNDKEAKLVLQALLTQRYSQMPVEQLSEKMERCGYKIDVNLSTEFQMGAIGY